MNVQHSYDTVDPLNGPPINPRCPRLASIIAALLVLDSEEIMRVRWERAAEQEDEPTEPWWDDDDDDWMLAVRHARHVARAVRAVPLDLSQPRSRASHRVVRPGTSAKATADPDGEPHSVVNEIGGRP
jgi:hypothetical protein